MANKLNTLNLRKLEDDESPQKETDEWGLTAAEREAVDLRLTTVDTISKDASEREPLTELQESGLTSLNFAEVIDGGSASLIQYDDFYQDVPEHILNFNKHSWLNELQKIKQGKQASFPMSLRDATKIQHLVVVRTHAYTAPVVDQKNNSFTKGTTNGDALLYDLNTGDYLGGTPWSAESEAEVQTLRDDLQAGLNTDMLRVGTAAVKEQVKKLAETVQYKK